MLNKSNIMIDENEVEKLKKFCFIAFLIILNKL